jgi:DNA-binding response OmpR family regulator
MYKILIADDEERICKIVERYGEFEGYKVVTVSDGMQAVEAVKREKFDIILLDVMMPELDGFSAAKKIRKESDVPIIIISARTEEYDKIHGFEIGADDYVTKPFSVKELMLRIRAVLNRKKGSENRNEVYENGRLKIDFTARLVYIDGERIELSPKEYELLNFMVKNKGIALSREKFINEVWGYDFFGDDRTLDTHIKLLRKKLGSLEILIATVRGVGYRFEAE